MSDSDDEEREEGFGDDGKRSVSRRVRFGDEKGRVRRRMGNEKEEEEREYEEELDGDEEEEDYAPVESK